MAMHFMFKAIGMLQDQRGVNMLDGGVPWYGVYETSDGGWMAVGSLEPQFYAELVAGLEIPDLPDRNDPKNIPALREAFTKRFKERTRDEWAATFTGTDACVEPVLSMAEAVEDEHLASRGTYVVKDGLAQPAPSPRFSRTPGALSVPPPVPGEHTVAVLNDWGVKDVDSLVEQGAAVQG